MVALLFELRFRLSTFPERQHLCGNDAPVLVQSYWLRVRSKYRLFALNTARPRTFLNDLADDLDRRREKACGPYSDN